jgi:two-component system, LytTR family, sensor kinase
MDTVSPRRKPWLLLAAIWLCVGVVQATQTVFGMRYAGMHHAWTRLFFTQVMCWLPWALATPLVVRLGRRLSLGSLTGWLTHLAAMAAIAVTSAGWQSILEALLKPWAPDGWPGPFLRTWLYNSFESAFVSLAIYAMILIVSFLLDSRQKLLRQQTQSAQLAQQLSQAQLNALRRQIEPHFIFNALNCIAGMVREQRNEGAVHMIVALSDVLRRLTRESTDAQVPLRREIEFLEKYFDIQKLRFADRLNVLMQVPEELLSAQVPSLILQPLVENAVKHGISQRAQGGTVQVAAACTQGQLSLRVYNDGPPLSEGWDSGSGVGLSNLKDRLQLLYGSQAALSVASFGITGVEVSVTLPFRECERAPSE